MKKILFLDLDGTIVKSSVILEFANYLIQKGIMKESNQQKNWLSDRKNDNYIREFGDYFRSQIIGMWDNDVRDLLQEFFNEFTFEFHNEVITLINKCKQENYFCCIISGSIDYAVQLMADKLGIQGYGTVYNVIDGKHTGNLDVPMFSQKEKQKIINTMITTHTEEVKGCGDTLSDVPIALVSDEFYLVAPSEHTLKEYNRMGIEYKLVGC